MGKTKHIIRCLSLFLFFSLLILYSKNTEFASSGMPHVSGNKIVNADGSPLILHGAQIEIFNIAAYNTKGTQAYNTYQHFSQTVQIMHNTWNMNIVRLPTCYYIWNSNQSSYMSNLQTAVTQANNAGLYVILEDHDDHQCNPPYQPTQEPYHLPRSGVDTYWTAMANAFKNNPMVIFDVYNEPSIWARNRDSYTAADWNIWLNGGVENDQNNQPVTYLGMQKLVNAIRATGAQQIIMVEGYSTAETWYGMTTNTMIHDTLNPSNIVYENHKYGMDQSSSNWDTDMGFMTKAPFNVPIFVGEWAAMGGDNSGQINCSKFTSPQAADTAVSNFLSYVDTHG